MTVSKVTNEWLNRLAGAYEIAGYDELRRNPSSALAVEHLDIVSALRELLAIRAADEGAVTVEGFADMRVFNDGPWNTLRGAANMMRVFMEGIDGDIPVTVTIRRKP